MYKKSFTEHSEKTTYLNNLLPIILYPMICNRPPELVDLTDESSSVNIGQYLNHTSPRSVANTNIYVDNNYSQDAANQEEANRPNPYDDSQEETPADVAMLLTTIAKTVSKEIETSHMEVQEIADAIPIFPTLYSNATNPSHQNNQYDGMDYEVEQYQDTLDPLKKKTRAVSMDCSKKYYTSPSPPHDEGEVIPTLLQWRDSISGRSTSPPHLGGIHSTPPPSPVVSSRKRGLTVPNSEHRRSNLSVKHHRNRPRSISLAETVVDHIPEFNLNPPDLSSVNDKKTKKLIMRKKFSWKNYPELEEFLVGTCLLVFVC